ncbi:dihydrolipoyl dehydrogenase [Candidatus Woesearchaeota archaeon]|nr:dihydrolipoyl dehydrogenase [Candidatus Woesearchaeota archaeon]
MESFDVIVIGAGSGLNIVDAAASQGLKVALVENGPMGGTCLNRGCIPSKMLIHSADVAETIRNAEKFGVKSRISSVNFKGIVSRVSRFVDNDSREIEASIRATRNITLFKEKGKFSGKKTLNVGNKTITADKIFIFAGTRPAIPPVKGIETSGYITSTEALRLQKLPKTLTIIGGGYIAAELAHFFGAMGSKVTILERGSTLVPSEDSEIAKAFTEAYGKKFNVLLGHSAESVSKAKGKFAVAATNGKTRRIVVSDQLLVAAGRTPNADILDVEKAGVKVNKEGFIVANDYLETTADGVWAGGDIAGKYQFKHSANLESQYIYHNAFNPKAKRKVDYSAMPHAIFSSPQIAGVGLKEQDLKKGSYAAGRYSYKDTGMGAALQDETGFAKILIEKKTGKILGCHIIGPDASTLIHEVVVAMKSGHGTIDNITRAVHVHPALSEVVQRAANSL